MQGLSYPLETIGGNLKVVSEYPVLVKNAILSSLLTKHQERVLRPEYGLGAVEFQQNSSIVAVLAQARQAIEIGLEGYPEVAYELRGSLNDSGTCDILVLYQVGDETPASLQVTL